MGIFTLNSAAVQRRIAALAKAAPAAMVSAVATECEAVLAVSTDAVPVDTGTLQADGRTAVAVDGDTSVVGRIGYGSTYPAADYALRVHEDPTNPKSKYLERPLNDAERGMSDRLGSRVARQLGL